ncbi:post-GPI attachment to proteins factor 2-like isoform X2 [Rhynchophorus ferrugineus]|uniref:post-GPI attachment to proteins factor 2-like isoform X2 n=1 Tax=Rhynchophorus ferrugineus TaxID=354439 RepID=UPI003FCEB039
MEVETTKNRKNVLVHYKINFKYVCLCTVSIPLGALIVCFISAYIFQYDDVHETHCKVFNIVPSISAVTGISPQKYIWRISIALHIGPRLQYKAQLWLNTAYCLNLIEAAALCGVTYISNRENYPVHEKLFITFMVSSLGHMIACIKGTQFAARTRQGMESVKSGLKYKKDLFVLSILCTIGLIFFFLQHRLFCFRMAFSMFALCEYVIAAANMAFHIAVISDFPTEDLMVAKLLEENSNDTKKLS